MAFGIETYRADGSVAMNGSNKAGIFIEVLSISGTGSKTYSSIPAGYLYYLVASSTGTHIITVTNDGAGNAKISWAINSQAVIQTTTYVQIFARKVTPSGTYGVSITGDSGDSLIDYTYPVPQYVATLTNPQAVAQGNVSYVTGPAGFVFKKAYTVPTTRNNTNRIALLYLPDSTSDDAWYACSGFLSANPSGGENVYVYCVSQTSQHKVPTVHLFSLDGPISGGGTFGIQLFGATGTLIYDSSAENVSVKDVATVETNGNNGAAVSYALALPTTTGVAAPFYEATWSAVSPAGYINERYLGVFQRKGSTIYYQIKLIDGAVNGRNDANATQYAQSGNEQGGGMMVVDVAQLSPQAFNFTS
jgi:hypothetical protein